MGFFKDTHKASFFNPSTHWLSPKAGTGMLQGTKIGYKAGLKGNLPFAILGAGYAMATAPRGHALSRGIGESTAYGATAIAGGIAGGMFGGPIGAWVGSVVAPLLFGEGVNHAIAGVVQPMVDFGAKMRGMKMGGDYRDTQVAMTMRQAASREMSTSLMNARQWLGSEAAFLHQ